MSDGYELLSSTFWPHLACFRCGALGRGGWPRRGTPAPSDGRGEAGQVRKAAPVPQASASTSVKWDHNAPAPAYLTPGVRDGAGRPPKASHPSCRDKRGAHHRRSRPPTHAKPPEPPEDATDPAEPGGALGSGTRKGLLPGARDRGGPPAPQLVPSSRQRPARVRRRRRQRPEAMESHRFLGRKSRAVLAVTGTLSRRFVVRIYRCGLGGSTRTRSWLIVSSSSSSANGSRRTHSPWLSAPPESVRGRPGSLAHVQTERDHDANDNDPDIEISSRPEGSPSISGNPLRVSPGTNSHCQVTTTGLAHNSGGRLWPCPLGHSATSPS